MPPKDDALGNMRSLGVRSLAVTCELCHHEAVLSAYEWPDAVLVRAFGPRMVCTRCGSSAQPRGRTDGRCQRAEIGVAIY
jgi:hypothetical protein